jgi:adenine C2-methylase RlmN of 23S rRNA A2503 and tRNA A37
MDPEKRRTYLPAARPPEEALQELVRYQQKTQKIIVLHWCFIEGFNDTFRGMDAIIRAVRASGLICTFNCVRYNPPPSSGTREAGNFQELSTYLSAGLGCPYQIVPRVGRHVYASCGEFVSKEKEC